LQEELHYEKNCVRYLLGELSEDEQTRFEEVYFADDSAFEQLLVVKDDLIDAYTRGDLRGPERERFEEYFLTSDLRRGRVAEAREFIRAATAAATKEAAVEASPNIAGKNDSWWQSISRTVGLQPFVLQAALAALLLVTLTASWLVIRNVRNQQAERESRQNEEAARRQKEAEVGRLTSDPVNSNPTEPSGNKTPAINPIKTPKDESANKESSPRSSTQVASLFLIPFSSRDGSNSNTLTLRSDTRVVNLHLGSKKNDYRRYDVSLQTVDGTQVLNRRGLKVTQDASGTKVTLTLNPSVFRQQDYIVRLSGFDAGGKLEPIGDYYFRVDRSTP
jgi:hypothetical protein